MDFVRTLKLKNEDETRQLGHSLADELERGDVVALIGDLGTGKTTLTRYIAEGLGIKSRVNSPTFTIVKEYHEGRLPFYHFDVYRICGEDAPGGYETGIEELYNIGIEEYFYGRGICIMEWADLIKEILPENTKYIYIEYGNEEGERAYNLSF